MTATSSSHDGLVARAALALALGALVGPSVSRVAAAEPPVARPTSLSWVRLSGAESCIEPRALAQEVERRLGGRPLVTPSRAELSIEGRIEPALDATGWHAVLTLADERGSIVGRRELRSGAAPCHAIDDELALIVTLLVDPNAAMAMPFPGAVEGAGVPVAPVALFPVPPPPPLPVPPPLSPPPPRPWKAGAGVGPTFGLGLLPAASVGGALRVDVTPPNWPTFLLGSTSWVENHKTVDSATAAFTLGYGTLLICPLGVGTVTRLLACGGAQVGVLHVDAVGFHTDHAQEEVVVNAAVEARVRHRLWGPLFAELGLTEIVPLLRRGYYYEDAHGSHDVYKMLGLSGSFDVTLGLEEP